MTYLIKLMLLLISFSVFSQNQLSGVDLSMIKTQKDSVLFKRAINDVQKFVAEGEFDRAQKINDQLVIIGMNMDYKHGLAYVYEQQGVIKNAFFSKIESDRSFQKSIEYFKEVNDLDGLANVYNDRYIIEKNKGNIEKAATYLLEAKLNREKLNDSIGLSGIYNNLAIIYKDLKNIQKSEEYYLKAIQLRKELKITGLGLVINNLALLHTENGNLDKAKELLTEALKINKNEDDLRHMAQSYSIMAKVAMYSDELEKAKKYYDTTLCVGSRTNFTMLVTNAKQQLGIIALMEGNYETSDKYLNTAREEFTKANFAPLLLKNYKYSFKLDSTRGNLLSAVKWLQQYQELSDQKMNDKTSRKVAETKSRYEAELQQLKLIEEQEKRERQTEAALFKYRLTSYIAIAVVLVILIFLILIIRTRNERKRLITKLDNSNEVKNKLFSIISHDLKNEINGLEGSLNLLKDNSISEKEFKEIIPFLANGTHRTSILLHNLLNWSKSQLKELNANPTSFDISEVINEKFTFFKNKADHKGIKLVNKLNHTQIFADKDMFAIVAQNLIANAIKFCNPGDSIALVSREEEDTYEICFEDTGIGIAPTNLGRLFAEDTFTTNGTQNESGTGLGLKICKELVELNKGKIRVESQLGEGSAFYVSLPKAA